MRHRWGRHGGATRAWTGTIAFLIGLAAALPLPAPAAATPSRALGPAWSHSVASKIARGAGARAGLAISAPVSANLGSKPTGTTSISASLGSVTVDDTRGLVVLGSWTATVSATDFTTGAGGTHQVIPKANIAYASLTATATSGIGVFTPGQATVMQAQSLSVPRTAFTGTSLLLNNSATWNPTVIVTIPAAAVAGTYTATITHSVL